MKSYLICVELNGEYKLAHRAVGNGSPNEEGQQVFSFLKNGDLAQFRQIMLHSVLIGEIDVDGLKWISKQLGVDDAQLFPQTDAYRKNILEFIMTAPEQGWVFFDHSSLAYNSYECHWVYVINLDESKLEVYMGKNTDGIDNEDERFYNDNVEEYPGYFSVAFHSEYTFKGIREMKMDAVKSN